MLRVLLNLYTAENNDWLTVQENFHILLEVPISLKMYGIDSLLTRQAGLSIIIVDRGRHPSGVTDT